MIATNGDRRLAVEYQPPVASLTDLPVAVKLHDRVVVAVNGVHQLGGQYHVKRRGSAVQLVTDLDQPWRPDPEAPGRKIFTFAEVLPNVAHDLPMVRSRRSRWVPPRIRSGWNRT